MGKALPDQTLDQILALQLTIAWAGEGRCEPKRLGWWDTDIVDEAGGGKLMQDLLPRTHRWAALEAAREAGRRVDARARTRMGDPDRLRTMFFLGFAVDEALEDRLAALKRSGTSPGEALSIRLDPGGFSKEALTAAFKQDEASYAVVPNGRQMSGALPGDVGVLVRRLAGGLVPFSDAYPLPFFKVGGS